MSMQRPTHLKQLKVMCIKKPNQKNTGQKEEVDTLSFPREGSKDT